ncbi:hypothetical protein F5880DRAFT_1502386 [Lentinula raphanica]|nr:hypothetical protein F5880DRAFT_1502386 [Lentinula raphanica]
MKLFSITFYFLLFVSFFHTQIPAVNAIAPDPTSACGGFWNWFTHHYDRAVCLECVDGGKHHIGAISWTKLVCKPFITAHRCTGPASNPVCQTLDDGGHSLAPFAEGRSEEMIIMEHPEAA